MAERICSCCGTFFNGDEIVCLSCKKREINEEKYSIEGSLYTYKEVLLRIQNGSYTGFSMVGSPEEQGRIPLNIHPQFLVYFLEEHKVVVHSGVQELSANDSRSKTKSNPSKKKKDGSKQMPKNKIDISNWVRFGVLFGVLTVVLLYVFEKQPKIFFSEGVSPPSRLVSFTQKSFDGKKTGRVDFPSWGDLESASVNLRNLEPNEWDSSLLGSFLITLSMIDNDVPKDVFDWISWAQNRYPEEASIQGAYISWRYRFSTGVAVCSEARSCSHDICLAVTEACEQNFSNDFLENPYRTRFYLMGILSKKEVPSDELIGGLPSSMQYGIRGDVALYDKKFEEAFRLYQESNTRGLDAEEEMIRSLVLLGQYQKAISLSKRMKASQPNRIRTEESKRLLVRSMIELGEYQDADILSSTLSDRRSQLHQHHLAYLMKKETSSSLDCIPNTHEERLYCARLLLMKEQYNEAIESVSEYPLGDPIRSLVSLLAAMRKGDEISMSDAIKTFAYGQPKLLFYQTLESASLPSIPYDEISKAVQGFIKDEEVRALNKWVFFKKSKSSVLRFDLVSAPICFASFQQALWERKYRLADEKLKCMSFFDIDERIQRFYSKVLLYIQNPDIYPEDSIHSLLEGDVSRTLLFWGEWVSTTEEKKELYQRRITGTNHSNVGVGIRWYQSLSKVVESVSVY